MAHMRGKYKGQLYYGRDAAVIMLRTFRKHNISLAHAPKPRLRLLRHVTNGQADLLLSITLDSGPLAALQAGKLKLAGNVVLIGVKTGDHEYLYACIKEGGAWKALTQPYAAKLEDLLPAQSR